MKPKHLEFVLHYLGTKDPAVAYARIYPNASVQSLSAAASRIMARPDVQDYIQFTERRMEDRLLNQIEAEQEAKKQQLLSINEKRAVLTRIITGETKRVRFIKNKYGPQKVEEDLPVYAVLRAVDMDTRLETFYNILLHRQDWSTQQSRTTYINTPTLQQQVNILISQTSQEQNNNSDSAQSPLSFCASTQNLPNAGTTAQSTSPLAQDGPTPKQILSQSITCPPLQLLQKKDSPFEGGRLVEAGGCALAPEKYPLQLTTEPDCNRVASLTPLKKTGNQLTKVNKIEKPIYNTTTKSTTKPPEGNQENSPPRRRKGDVLPLVTPMPTIDYNPYTLEPLDPTIDYSYKPPTGNPPILPYIAPIPGKIIVKPTIREYD